MIGSFYKVLHYCYINAQNSYVMLCQNPSNPPNFLKTKKQPNKQIKQNHKPPQQNPNPPKPTVSQYA